MTTAYVDASALVKLVLDEPGAAPMRRWYVEAEEILTSEVGVIETRRAVRGIADPGKHLDSILASVAVVRLDVAIGRVAAALGPPGLRTLDAIHVASALAIPGIDAFVTYDDHQAEAARAVGLPVVRPA